MHYIFTTLLLTFSTVASAQLQNPFEAIEYDKVVAYEFKGDGARLIKYCLKREPNRISDSVTISKKHIRKLEKVLAANKSYGGTTATCFDPHLALVYYKNQQIVATVDICLDCNSLLPSFEIPATKHKMIKVDDDYSYPAHGFSKGARKSIHQFCTKIGFTQYLKPLESVFDE